DIPAHGAIGSRRVGNQNRVAFDVAAGRLERALVGSLRYALLPHRGGLRGGKEALHAGDAAGDTAPASTSTSAIGERTGGCLEVRRIPEEVPAVGELVNAAEIVVAVNDVPRLY